MSRPAFTARYAQLLAPYAVPHHSPLSARPAPNPEDPQRLPFQRDRDRIVHSRAFRRLRGKMQVVAPDTGDHYRNRLTHTLEVTQIARDLARTLGLNEDLCECIALGHDLGHPPFGHAGERALDQSLRPHGHHFSHNSQSYRIVTQLEHPYPHWPGLNLTWAVAQGLRKHDTAFTLPDGTPVHRPHLEMLIVDYADEIAYLAADLEDALRGRYLTLSALQSVGVCALVWPQLEFTTGPYAALGLTRKVIGYLIAQLTAEVTARLTTHGISSVTAAQQCPNALVGYPPAVQSAFTQTKSYLSQHYYHAPAVTAMTTHGQTIITQIFDSLLHDPSRLPASFAPHHPLLQRITDYIAGMTDHFATDFLASAQPPADKPNHPPRA